MTSMFTCISCRVAFKDADVQRQHYKTDWHRYNLKRKVAELPPVTAEIFQEKVLEQREKDEAESKNSSFFCKVCRKLFSSYKAFQNHITSKKHKDNLAIHGPLPEDGNKEISDINTVRSSKVKLKDSEAMELSDNSDVEEVDSDEWENEISENNPILNNNCLFCPHHSKTMLKNITHLSLEHSFFVPDIEYVCDMKGLLLYLGEKICQGYMCLWCNDRGKTFYSVEAAQYHMLDKGHCKMLHEGEALAEYAEYYDYSSSYPDTSDTFDESEVSVSHNDSDYQLVLPSGATIGHRSLMRYYRQNFDPNKVVAPLQKKVHRVIAQYRALGWTLTDKEAVCRKAKDLQFMKRVQAKQSMRLGVKANKMQHHFRPQVNF